MESGVETEDVGEAVTREVDHVIRLFFVVVLTGDGDLHMQKSNSISRVFFTFFAFFEVFLFET